MQKSQLGLLQSLLYQILLACPRLILELCELHPATAPWTLTDLSQALDQVAKQTTLPTKFCFFIDGLDEYEGDEEDIIDLIHELATSPNIKLCVSSRPWNAFLDAFEGSKWKLTLEDLTKDDIKMYVQEMLAKDKTYKRVATQDPRCDTLVSQIAEKAHGVWLWVYLVVRDLIRDLKGEEEYPFLQRRLDSFPEELEKYFENILSRIDKIHRQETAQIFLIAVEAVRPLPVLALKYLGRENEDSDYALSLNVAPISDDEAEESFKKWRKLLNSRCRDLLEVDSNSSDHCKSFLKYRVDFLHRTVRDFLRDNYQKELQSRTASDFDARLSLCKIILALIKGLPIQTQADFRDLLNDLLGLVDELLYYVRELERKTGRPSTTLLDELDRVNTIHAHDARVHWTNFRDHPEDTEFFKEYGQCSFLALAIQARLRLYALEKLDADQGRLFEKRGRPLLDYALRPRRITPAELPYQLQEEDMNIDAQLVEALLSRGADPNQKIHIYGGMTVWCLFLSFSLTDHDPLRPSTRSKTEPNAQLRAIEALIEHGADQKVVIPNLRVGQDIGKKQQTARYKRDVVVIHEDPKIDEILKRSFGSAEAARLVARMEEVASRKRDEGSVFWKMLRWPSFSSRS